MRRPAGGVWNAWAGGQLPALAVVSAFFFAGGLVGCLAAAGAGGAGLQTLTDYLEGFLASVRTAGTQPPALLPLVWGVVRWPLLAVLLGFTALGILGLPLLFSVRGFVLAFSIAAFVRIFGGMGGVLAFLLFGVSGLVSVPVLFLLGVQSLGAAQALAVRFLGDGRRSPVYGRIYWQRCGLCAAALCLCVVLEYLAVPALVAAAAGALAV